MGRARRAAAAGCVIAPNGGRKRVGGRRCPSGSQNEVLIVAHRSLPTLRLRQVPPSRSLRFTSFAAVAALTALSLLAAIDCGAATGATKGTRDPAATRNSEDGTTQPPTDAGEASIADNRYVWSSTDGPEDVAEGSTLNAAPFVDPYACDEEGSDGGATHGMSIYAWTICFTTGVPPQDRFGERLMPLLRARWLDGGGALDAAELRTFGELSFQRECIDYELCVEHIPKLQDLTTDPDGRKWAEYILRTAPRSMRNWREHARQACNQLRKQFPKYWNQCEEDKI
jgi:hypothetical protein